MKHLCGNSFAFPLDSVYLLMEPCFKTSVFRTNCMIRVDNPTLLVRINDEAASDMKLLLTRCVPMREKSCAVCFH